MPIVKYSVEPIERVEIISIDFYISGKECDGPTYLIDEKPFKCIVETNFELHIFKTNCLKTIHFTNADFEEGDEEFCIEDFLGSELVCVSEIQDENQHELFWKRLNKMKGTF